MTKQEIKEELENILFSYRHDIIDTPDIIPLLEKIMKSI